MSVYAYTPEAILQWNHGSDSESERKSSLTVHQLLVCVLVAATSWMTTTVVRRYAVSHDVLDTPNHRSSHTIPTPRGGGLSIVVTSLTVVFILIASHRLPMKTGLALTLGGGAMALVGWVDDKHHLGVRLRFAVHLASAVWALVRTPVTFGH